MFTFAYGLIPYPIFPGNVLVSEVGPAVGEYAWLLSAVFNGVFYGFLLWLVFVILSNRLGEEK
jgi:hypothetical protein